MLCCVRIRFKKEKKKSDFLNVTRVFNFNFAILFFEFKFLVPVKRKNNERKHSFLWRIKVVKTLIQIWGFLSWQTAQFLACNFSRILVVHKVNYKMSSFKYISKEKNNKQYTLGQVIAFYWITIIHCSQ